MCCIISHDVAVRYLKGKDVDDVWPYTVPEISCVLQRSCPCDLRDFAHALQLRVQLCRMASWLVRSWSCVRRAPLRSGPLRRLGLACGALHPSTFKARFLRGPPMWVGARSSQDAATVYTMAEPRPSHRLVALCESTALVELEDHHTCRCYSNER